MHSLLLLPLFLSLRWAFVLAVIAFFDCWILGILAFTLAHRCVCFSLLSAIN